jgi:predicted histone-like DNA-binding protein
MSVFYNKVERRKPGAPQAEKKWYAIIKSISQVKEKKVAKQIADETTLNPKEAEMSLYQLQKVLIRLLSEGNSVQLGDWGSFHLTCNSKGHDKKEEVSANSIEKVNIRFVQGKDLKEALQKISFRDASTMSNEK